MRKQFRQQRKLSTRGLDSQHSQTGYFIKTPKSNRKSYIKTESNDTLQNFQHQLTDMIRNRKRAYYDIRTRTPTKSLYEETSAMQLAGLKKQLSYIKQTLDQQKQIQKIDKKLQTILREISIKTREKPKVQIQTPQNFLPQILPFISPQQHYFPPYPYYPMPPQPHNYPRKRRNRTDYELQESQSQESQDGRKKSKNQRKTGGLNRKEIIRRKLRKIFFVVAFPFFLKSESIKLTKIRRNNLRNYWLQKFDQQTNCIKNWLLQANKYTFAIFIDKKKLDLRYQNQPKVKIRQQKQRLLLQLLQLSLRQLLVVCTAQKMSLFTESLQNLCQFGSFIMSRFWTARQMDIICISQYFGFIRVDQYGQKCLIGLFIFLKMFVYNMLLQPHKFDSVSFPKGSQPLSKNLHLFGSIYYYLVKQVLNGYIDKRSYNKYYNYGNWLKTPKQFIVQCSEPLVYNKAYSDNQLISGMVDDSIIEILKQSDLQKWNTCKDTLMLIIDKLHEITLQKKKLTKKNLKYKLYN